jgi:cytochrome c-type biogenesis protein CcmH/NrfF
MFPLILLQSQPFIPISAFVLCFLPLAVTIIGFIVAARATDRQATAPYLRLDPAKSNEEAGTPPV